MHIQSVHIRNFRKLKNCHIDFSKAETVFVGANNSGKTSAISAIVWFLKNKEKFTLKEFTITNWNLINELGNEWSKPKVDEELLNLNKWDEIVPSMDIWIDIEEGEQYRVNHLIPSLSTWKGKKVGVRVQYVPKDVTKLYSDYKTAKEKADELRKSPKWKDASSPELFPKNLCDFLGKGTNLKDYFDVKYYIIDPAIEPDDKDNVQPTPNYALDSNPLKDLIRVDTILASRDFSDPEGQSESEIDTLSRQFQKYFSSLNPDENTLSPDDLELVSGIAKANATYDAKLNKTFEKPVEELKNINYPGFQNPEIRIRSMIQIEEAIKHDSAVQFAIQGMSDLALPEKYNGLGYRNLISIYLKLMDFREQWLKGVNEGKNIEPIHLVFVEEPEAHLHAQAQQVFVKKAFDALCNSKIIRDNLWLKTQLVLTTHSNHIINELDLNQLRYFRRVCDTDSEIPVTKVINLSGTFGSTEETQRFVTRYIRLTHCDIFFADAVIFVEGPAEKILVPSFLAKSELDSYYIAVIEVNGRHAHRFKSLIENLGIPTLIVTDIDATKIATSGGRPKAVITDIGKGYKSGNPAIKSWLDKTSIDDLIGLDEDDKTIDNVRIAFQTPICVKWSHEEEEEEEEKIFPYTFEDALIFSNLELFRQEKLKTRGTVSLIVKLLNENSSAKNLQKSIFDKLDSRHSFQKADFANALLYEECFDALTTPAYIQEGLEWLKKCLDNE